jgi:hypothetical protein
LAAVSCDSWLRSPSLCLGQLSENSQLVTSLRLRLPLVTSRSSDKHRHPNPSLFSPVALADITPGNTSYAALTAVLAANIVLAGYVYLAFAEDKADREAEKAKLGKAQ